MAGKKQMPTKRTRDIVAEIRRYIAEHGFAPTLREIMAGTGITSTSVINYHLYHLQETGVITRDEGKARSIRLTGTPEPFFAGRITEGHADIRLPPMALKATGDLWFHADAPNDLAEK
jgi:repressor LexA|tara:strand:+ start:915 stop:1268 length:354 start_codon:yes stop_codon:yes gene_type:complete